jgi:superfamily II DNA or RNA helicase
MALRLDPVRLLIADDVGVGKTIEALLIAREMYDRGEIKTICILCPPYLCEQWQKELSDKFNLSSVIIRSGTVSQLERPTGGRKSIYEYYPVQIASIDYLKRDNNRYQFLQHLPDFIIVDEAHGAAAALDSNQTQHQRHRLIKEIAAREKQRLVLLTATPHSGIDSAFKSLLSLLNPAFGSWDIDSLSEQQRIELAKHFVQRTRRDIEHDWETDHCFPTRVSEDKVYQLSSSYEKLFKETYDFCSEIVKSGQHLNKRQQRVRYWAALGLLRCVMSSPAAATASLESRHDLIDIDEDEPSFGSMVFESSDERKDDEQPTSAISEAEQSLGSGDKKKLRELAALASKLDGTKDDTKLHGCAELVSKLIKDGHQTIVWCRYIATAEYVARNLQSILRKTHPDLRVVSITGRMGDDERKTKVEELAQEPVRILVATDCLSEGMNLQHAFNAALHYDLPWNPNRLEQREGRVDRYGQISKEVKVIRYFSPDSAVDGVVLEVLLNKAREIHRTLGTHVPVPEESESVTQALLNALFLRAQPPVKSATNQLTFDFGEDDEVERFHEKWKAEAEREKINRTRFAQRALKPGEVQRELEETDAVLGDPNAVREFFIASAQRIGLVVGPVKKSKKDAVRSEGVMEVQTTSEMVSHLPDAIRLAIPNRPNGWKVSFDSPTPEGADYVGRNHPFISALARFLMEEAMTSGGKAIASRCGAIRTKTVKERTFLYLQRVRYLVEQPELSELLSEEVVVSGAIQGSDSETAWLTSEDSLNLLVNAKPDQNMKIEDKTRLAQIAIDHWTAHSEHVTAGMLERATELEKSYKRIRQAVSMRVRQLKVVPQLPPDLLGVLVLEPVEK